MISYKRKLSKSWKNIPWKKFRRIVFRLQIRIYKAQRAGDKHRAINLMKLLLRSYAARMLAIRQVTQLNAGKKTAGIDGKASLNFEERFALEKILKSHALDWKHSRLRSIPIPKKDGTTRILKVPTIADRAWQALIKIAIEPAHEATFHARSYGFRPGRSAHDAQKLLYLNLSSNVNGESKRVLEIDISKCFDRLSHTTILNEMIAPQKIKTGTLRCLKAGINPEFPDQGMPQGGVVSPLLANIALNGIEEIHNVIRYADDMVIILKPKDNAEEILDKIKTFLANRGCSINEKKTKITRAIDGFDFLGWHFKVQKNGKFRCTPSEENFKAFQQKVKSIVNNSNYGAKVKAQKLAPLVRGWKNYHKHCDMSNARFSLYFVQYRTFKVFNKERKQNRYSSKKLLDQAFPNVKYSENRHINVKGNKTPFDGDITYWSQRNSKRYDGPTAQTLRRQKHRCGECGLTLLPGEKVHLHHIDGNHNNWRHKNLIALHESCHDYLHMS